MVTPAPVPVNPVTSDPDLERLRSSPFPHYDPEQHPWAPSPPSQVNTHTLILSLSPKDLTYVCTICMYVCMYAHMYTRIYVCMYICMYKSMYVHHSCGCIH